MLTYELKKSPGVPLYEALYRCIRADILSGKLTPNTKLPSKRALAEHLEISKITVETAYSQLLEEGYIRSQQKVGYFVEPILQKTPMPAPVKSREEASADNGVGPEKFPFSVWSRLQREVMLDYGEKLLLPLHNQGSFELRQAIADHLAQFRGMSVDPGNILVGAGTDFLYNLLIQLLGRDKIYAVEEPGYDKIRKIYAAGGVACVSAEMDERGVVPGKLGDARILHISPAHHFPLGLVTPLSRRQELLRWAADRDGYIIEDDYDSEFRFDAHPVPTMMSLDGSGRVVYMNTFSKSLAPSIRISYMVLPEGMMQKFREKLGFYSCTVSSFEQMTLARFLSRGHFEKHINRMRRYYRARRNRILEILKTCCFAHLLSIREEDAGLHFLLSVDTQLSDEALVARCAEAGLKVRALSSFYHTPVGDKVAHCLVVNYATLREGELEAALKNLSKTQSPIDGIPKT